MNQYQKRIQTTIASLTALCDKMNGATQLEAALERAVRRPDWDFLPERFDNTTNMVDDASAAFEDVDEALSNISSAMTAIKDAMWVIERGAKALAKMPPRMTAAQREEAARRRANKVYADMLNTGIKRKAR